MGFRRFRPVMDFGKSMTSRIPLKTNILENPCLPGILRPPFTHEFPPITDFLNLLSLADSLLSWISRTSCRLQIPSCHEFLEPLVACGFPHVMDSLNPLSLTDFLLLRIPRTSCRLPISSCRSQIPSCHRFPELLVTNFLSSQNPRNLFTRLKFQNFMTELKFLK